MLMYTKVIAVIVAFFFVSFTFVSLNIVAETNSPAQYSVIGKISLPSGYSMANTNSLPFAYLQTTNTIFVFAEKTATSTIYLLALTTAGVLRAPPIPFAGGVSGFYAYDQKDGRLFYAGWSGTIWGNTRIIAVSTSSYKVVANYTIPSKYSSGYYLTYVPISSFAYNPTNGMLYVTGWFQSMNYVVLFNARTNALVKAIPLSDADYAIYDARNSLVYALYNPSFTAVAAISGSQVVGRLSLLNEFQSWSGAAILNTQNSVLFVYSLNEAETNCPSVVGVNTTTMSALGDWSMGVPSYGDTLYPPSYADSRGYVYGNYVISGGGVVNWCDFPPGTLPTTSVEYAVSTGSLVASSPINAGASILSVPQLQANFVSLSGTAKAGYHVNVYSASTGKLLAQIPGTFVPFGYNVASNIVYAAGANNYIYKISG
jgi:hypothetical protein